MWVFTSLVSSATCLNLVHPRSKEFKEKKASLGKHMYIRNNFVLIKIKKVTKINMGYLQCCLKFYGTDSD